MERLDLRAISSALFLPLLLWTGSVIAISLFGYPGVICMTPVAWFLALPVGLRVRRESENMGSMMLREAAFSGALLGFWQGLLLAATVAASPYLPGKIYSGDLPSPIFVALFGVLVSIPITAALSAGIAWLGRRN